MAERSRTACWSKCAPAARRWEGPQRWPAPGGAPRRPLYEWNELLQAGFDQRQQARPAIPTGFVAMNFGIKRGILEAPRRPMVVR